jgi:hypothetical protein
MKRLSILWLVAIISLSSCAIQEKGPVQEKETIKESNSDSFQPKPLDDQWSKWLIGTWQVVSGQSDFLGGDELEGVGDPNEQGAGGFTIEFGLNGQFLIWTSWAEGEVTEEQKKQIKEAFKETTDASDEDLERFVSMPYKSLYIQTVDPKTGERIGYFFDSMRCIATGKGKLEGNKEITEWQWFVTGRGATSVNIIKKIDDNKCAVSHKYTLPDGKIMEEKMQMVRKKESP